MFDLKKYNQGKNDEVRESYDNGLSSIREIYERTADFENAGAKEEPFKFFHHAGDFLLKMAQNESKLEPDYFLSKDLDELMNENHGLYEELFPQNYMSSYANPSYCVYVLGLETGQFFSWLYQSIRQSISATISHKIFRMDEMNRLFIDVFNHVDQEGTHYGELKKYAQKHGKRDRTGEMTDNLTENFDTNYSYCYDIVMESDLANPKYAFMYGSYVTDFELQTARFLQNYPKEKIEKMANQIVAAYEKGFRLKGKDPHKKPNVMIGYHIGQEIILRKIVNVLKDKSLKAIVRQPQSTRANRQYDYDHRFDLALYVDEELSKVLVGSNRNAFEYCKYFLGEYSGTIYLSQFGEKPFKPEDKKENLKLSDEQHKLYQDIQNEIMKLDEQYIPRSETSFTIMAVPSPEIGDRYEEIFEDILELNMIESERYEGIQQKIIDVLDRTDHIHVKGQEGNLTDIKVKMQKLDDPTKETNFVNCGADLNIPVGEVFTSPCLTGTNGLLHIGETFLNKLKYIDLKLTFENGFISAYECGNFDDAETNKKYIQENLIFPHKTLPMGEFAIGTNTMAYVIANKYQILDVLPILIIEKMGPHFAIGDTCFSHEEDVKIFNPTDNKEITARDNEKSILRNEDFNKAYTYVHTDITLPYKEIGYISAVTKDDEKIDIIRNGRFVLEGTEELNKPFEK